ncbi:hypothetical protein A5740_17815 [Mycobacterium sp. GA-1841]|uniref:alpha/beta hydrolase n=1 Tax=Mycobacterium sp. GA-1841 TaxID=1834154 RepID=UPI00096FEADD|nr:alpha/beta hydrolase [Mycobacterium sp. GA-1841]OMC29626.1 hypothetical protein A5740_17815 [Mycobacterium sp. GA-1841]
MVRSANYPNRQPPAQIDPSLRPVARLLPYRTSFLTRRLRLVRRVSPILERAFSIRDAEVTEVSSTASVRVFRPSRPLDAMPAILWIHGGGYVAGSAALVDRAMRRLSEQTQAVVASVEYRLAPEHRFPAALDDCHSALTWLTALPFIDVQRIVLAGRSAGGGLAAALALRCVDEQLVELAGQVLIYPMLDDRTVRRTTVAAARGWTLQDNDFGWSAYLGREPGSDGISAYAAPGRREDLSGMPRTWIGIGTADLFYDEVVDYANRLLKADVETELAVVDGAFHGFDFVGAPTKLARTFRDQSLSAMRNFLGTGGRMVEGPETAHGTP